MGRKNRRTKQDGIRQQKLLNELVDNLLKLCSALVPRTLVELSEDHHKIQKAVEEIRILENQQENRPLKLANREDNFAEFLEWLQSKGVSVDKVDIAKFGADNWGLRAKQPIKDGQLWLTVPHEIMMTTLTAQQSPLGDVIKTDPITRHLPQVALSLHLLEERLDPNSFWKPYLDILPSSYETVLYFGSKDFELLKGSPCFEESLKHYRHIARQYAYFWKLFRRPDVGQELRLKTAFTYDAYRWATSTVMTRQNSVPALDGTHQPLCALIPFWDMCNHAFGKLTTDFDLAKGTLECYSLRDFDEGDQVYIFYGPRPNSEFFLHNAFVDATNEHDTVAIKLGISKNDVLNSKKDSLLQKINIQRIDTFHVTVAEQPINSRLWAFSRVFNMTEVELDSWLSLEDDNEIVKGLGGTVSDDLQDRAEKFLQDRLKLILRTYPTTQQEDEVLLLATVEGRLTNRERLAVNLRSAEKKILSMAIDKLNSSSKKRA